jgi:hypothetical protein
VEDAVGPRTREYGKAARHRAHERSAARVVGVLAEDLEPAGNPPGVKRSPALGGHVRQDEIEEGRLRPDFAGREAVPAE